MAKTSKKINFLLLWSIAFGALPNLVSISSCSSGQKPTSLVNITIFAGQGGKVVGESVVALPSGSVFKMVKGLFDLHIAEDEGYKFDKWIDTTSGEEVADDTVLNADISLEALFVEDMPEITVNALEHGSVVGGGVYEYKRGTIFKDIKDELTGCLKPDSEYEFDKWVDASLRPISDDYQIVDSTPIFAQFKAMTTLKITVNFLPDEHCSISGETSAEIDKGTKFGDVKEHFSEIAGVLPQEHYDHDIWVNQSGSEISDDFIINLDEFNITAKCSTKKSYFLFKKSEQGDHAIIDKYIGPETSEKVHEIIVPNWATCDNGGVLRVLEAGPSSFFDNDDITSVILPRHFFYIDYSVFENCDNLEKIVLPMSLNHLGGCCFKDCINLTSLNLDDAINLSDLPLEMCRGCKKLENLDLPYNLQRIDEGALRDCSALKQIVLPKTVYDVGPGAFRNCVNLETAILSDCPITEFHPGSRMFCECYKLHEIQLPRVLIEIPMLFLTFDVGLEYIELPASIQTICSGSFFETTNLTNTSGPGGSCGYRFLGTKEQWKLVKKAEDGWHPEGKDYTKILCLDGECGLDDKK